MMADEPHIRAGTGLPPLNAIRCYVAVVREGGVTAAAAALGITQSAASRHVANLERYLGTRLTIRRGRGAEPTDAGRVFALSVGDALDAIDFTARRMRGPSTARRLTVRTSLPSFAYGVLVPHLPAFSAAAPGVALDLVTSLSPPSPDDPFDVLVTRDLRLRAEHDHWHVLSEQAVLIVPPGQGGSAASPEQAVAALPLLSVTSRPDLVPRWAAALGIPLRSLRPGPAFGHTFMALQAVATGQGALVVPDILAAAGAEAGALAVVARSRVATGMDYTAYVGCAPERHDAAASFCRWLVRLCRDLQKALPEAGLISGKTERSAVGLCPKKWNERPILR